MQGYGENFIIVVPAPAGDWMHTATRPFCPDDSCPCHEDPALIADVQTLYQNGLVTSQEATRIIEGKSLG